MPRRRLQKTRRSRRRLQKTRRSRKQSGAASPLTLESVVAAMQRAFPEEEMEADEHDGEIEVSFMCMGSGDAVIHVSFNPELMYIHQVYNCPPHHTGSEILDGLIAVGRELGMPSIQLIDDSTVYYPSTELGNQSCAAKLYVIKILTRDDHLSWYGSMGFQSVDGESEEKAEQVANRELAESAMRERLLPAMAEAAKRRMLRLEQDASRHRVALLENNDASIKQERRDLRRRLKEIEEEDWVARAADGLEAAFPGIADLSVQDAMNYMLSQRAGWDACDHPQVQAFLAVCRAAESLITYQGRRMLVL